MSLDTARERLTSLRHGLLHLHKTLLDSERLAYERVHGRIASPGEFLQLVMGDTQFAWLRPISELIVLIDETLDAVDPVTALEARRLVMQARALLKPAEQGSGFGKQYFDALQRDPDVVLAHAELSKFFAGDMSN